jgi:putative ABC transport system permease protein
MFRNYFKIAIAVLKRRKFFTFISLFGISFTLTILIVASAFVEKLIGENYPEVNRDRSLYINFVHQQNLKYSYSQNGPASYYYMDHYVNTLKTPEKVAISSLFAPVNTYVNNKKLVVNIKYTNEAWWDVLQFKFIEGKPYTQQQIDNGEHVAVISEDLKNDYFGDVPNVVGKYIEADNVQYRVTGVVKSVAVTMLVSYGDLYAPYTISKTDYRKKGIMGNYGAVLLAHSKADISKIQQEYADVVGKIKPDDKNFDVVKSSADNYLLSFISVNSKSSAVAIIITVVAVFVLFIMLLPALNLININISRIMERSSEIGVRKAFGASSKVLVWQFIIENIILTFLGAVIAIILSFIILQVINNTDLIPNLVVSINFTVLLYSLIACLLFGLVSGVFPAWRMSRLQIVTALKAQ